MVMKYAVFEGETCGGFFGGNLFLTSSPGKPVLNFDTKFLPHSSH